MIPKLNFTQINALAEPELELFTNSFSYHDDDYFHKNIGSLFGIIQVTDHSKNSEYLPNLLTSILKKTFYSNTGKSTEQNFELALKKVNLALADLAEHDIVEWNKDLHALVGVLHGDKLFFTQVGDALISIGRGDKIMHLSEPGAPLAHPIKTFQDIIVGKVELGDKIIISTPTILDIFKLDDINRLFKTFSTKEFDDIFFKTLKKEGENISAVVVNVENEEQLDYSKSKSLNNEDVPLEELTKNKNFLGDKIKSRKNKSGEVPPSNVTSNIVDDSLDKLSTPAKTRERKGIVKTAVPKKTKKGKDSLSKKQALDIAQKEAAVTKKEVVNKKKKSSKMAPKDVPTKTTITTQKTKLLSGVSIPGQSVPAKKATKTGDAKIKSISSTTTKIKPKSKILKTTPTRKLNDLKDVKKKTEPINISPFEEMQEIYIKDDDLAKKAKKPSTKKLKSFFHKSNSTKKSTPTTSPIVKPVQANESPTPITSISKTATKTAPIVETPLENTSPIPQDVLDTLLPKKTSSANTVNLSEYFGKATSLINTIWNTLFKFLKNVLHSLKKIRPRLPKPSSTRLNPSSNRQPKAYAYNSQTQSDTISKGSSALVKKSTSKLFLLLQSIFKKIIPLFKLLSRKLLPFTKKYRIAILIILFIILVPVIIGSFTKSKQNKETAEKLKLPAAPIANIAKPIIKNKNQTRKILSLATPIKLLASNDAVLIAYTEDSQLYEIDKQTNKSEKLTLPENVQLSEIKAIDYIGSLNLFFLSSDTTTISYSAKVKKFIPNKIILPTDFKLAGQNTYLSYLYLLDSSSKQIYRYPRATGGFALSKKWLVNSLTHNATLSAMAIDENVRIAYLDGTVEKYSKGKLLNTKKFELKSLDFIETTEGLKSYYLLSKEDGKILKINKNNDSVEREYQNTAIQNTTTFTVDEKTKLLHIFDGKELLSIDL